VLDGPRRTGDGYCGPSFWILMAIASRSPMKRVRKNEAFPAGH
jgi:hypothetical protein